MAGQTFEINLESVTLYVNGYTEATHVDAEEVDGEAGIYFGRTVDGILAAVEIYGPVRVSTEKSAMRVATRYLREQAMNERLGTEKSDELMQETAHRTAAESGTSYQQRANRSLRGEGSVNPESEGENEDGAARGGMVVNPNTTKDSGRDVMDSNARDNSQGAFGRHGVSQDHVAVSSVPEENAGNPEEIMNPDRAGQNDPARAEEAAGDSQRGVEMHKEDESKEEEKLGERHDALASSGDVLGNNSESARLAVTNSEDEEKARQEEEAKEGKRSVKATKAASKSDDAKGSASEDASKS